MAVWIAYIDFSGTDPNQPFVSVGIVLGTANTWNKVVPQWDGVLEKYQLPDFHATDFFNFAPPYEKLTKKEHTSCIKELIGAISDVNLQYQFHIMRKSECNLALTEFPQLRKFEPYDYMLELGIFELARWSKAKSLNTDVRVIIEAGEKHNSGVFRLIQQMSSEGNLQKVSQIQSIDKKRCFPLRVADLIAHENYRDAMNKISAVMRPERRSFTAIKSGNPWKHYPHNYITVKEWIKKTHLLLMSYPQAKGKFW